jgi:hypothetical protein
VRLRGGYNPFDDNSTNTVESVRVHVARTTTPASFADLLPVEYAETVRDIESLRG